MLYNSQRGNWHTYIDGCCSLRHYVVSIVRIHCAIFAANVASTAVVTYPLIGCCNKIMNINILCNCF